MLNTGSPIRPIQPLRVLLVEDSRDDADLLRQELVSQGYLPDVLRVQSRAELESALGETGWDVLISDHALPGFDSFSALAMVQARGVDVPFIIVSSAIHEVAAVEAMRVGAHDFLSKGKLARLGAVIERERRECAIRVERCKMQQQLLLSDRLVSIGTLAAGVAHEINNPLSYVVGNIDFALSYLEVVARDCTDVVRSTR